MTAGGRKGHRRAPRWLAGAILAVMALAACGEPATESPSSNQATAAPSTTTTTTTTSSTTTTTVPTSIPIFETTRFAPGTRYRGVLPQLDVEYELEFELDGWRVHVVSQSLGDFIHLWNWEQDLPTGAEGNLVLFMSELPIGELAAFYAAHPRMADATEPVETMVAGNPAYQVDVLVAATDDPVPFDACGGLPLTDDGPWRMNIGACSWARIWVVDVDGVTVTAWVTAAFEDLTQGGIAGEGEGNLLPDQVWQFEDFQPLIDDFVGALSFCTDATPCDES